MQNNQKRIFDGYDVTPHDTNTQEFDCLWIGSAGDVAVEFSTGRTLVFPNCVSGYLLRVSGVKVLSTGTNATSIKACKVS